MKATTIVGMILGIVGGLIALFFGAGGFGLASIGGQLSGAIGYQDGITSAFLYKIAAVAFPAIAILGAGVAPKAPKTSTLLQLASVGGILLVFGINSLSLIPSVLIILGAFFIGSELSRAGTNEVSDFRMDAKFFITCSVSAFIIGLIMFLTFSLFLFLPSGGYIYRYAPGLVFVVSGILLGSVRGACSALLAGIIFNVLGLVVFPILGLHFNPLGMSSILLMPFGFGILAAIVSGLSIRGRQRSSGVPVFIAALLGNATILTLASLRAYFSYDLDPLALLVSGASSAILVSVAVTLVVVSVVKFRPGWIAVPSQKFN